MNIIIPYSTMAAIELFASAKDVRGYLEYTHVVLADPHKAYVTASDGKMLARAVIFSEAPMGTTGEALLVPRCAASFRNCRPYTFIRIDSLPSQDADNDVAGHDMRASCGDTSMVLRASWHASSFPDVAHRWPKTLSLKGAAYDAELTARLAKAKKLLGVKRPAYVLPNGDDAPGLCELGDDFAVIVMPVRTKAAGASQVTLCEWHGTKLAYPDPEPANEAAS